MSKCEQFIYTTGKTKRKTGYQVTAKSQGISDELISECSNYLYPLGIKHTEFKQSRSLILLNGKVVFSITKNIGISFDGRPGTIYCHAFVISKTEFLKLDNDSRFFEIYYKEIPSFHSNLLSISIEPKQIPINFKIIDQLMPILPEVLNGLFGGGRIALLKSYQYDLIQNVLSIVPPSVRLISFSTLVNYPNRQPKYDFILSPKYDLPNLDKKFRKINREESSLSANKKTKSALETSIEYLLELIRFRKVDQLNEIHKDFEKIPGTDFKNKIILVMNYSKFKTTTDKKLKQKFADNIFEIIKKLDKKIALQYLEKIKEYSKHYAELERQIQPVINPYTSFIDAIVLLPVKVTADIISSYVEFQKKLRRKYSDSDE